MNEAGIFWVVGTSLPYEKDEVLRRKLGASLDVCSELRWVRGLPNNVCCSPDRAFEESGCRHQLIAFNPQRRNQRRKENCRVIGLE